MQYRIAMKVVVWRILGSNVLFVALSRDRVSVWLIQIFQEPRFYISAYCVQTPIVADPDCCDPDCCDPDCCTNHRWRSAEPRDQVDPAFHSFKLDASCSSRTSARSKRILNSLSVFSFASRSAFSLNASNPKNATAVNAVANAT